MSKENPDKRRYIWYVVGRYLKLPVCNASIMQLRRKVSQYPLIDFLCEICTDPLFTCLPSHARKKMYRIGVILKIHGCGKVEKLTHHKTHLNTAHSQLFIGETNWTLKFNTHSLDEVDFDPFVIFSATRWC